MIDMKSIEGKVKDAISQIRPFLNDDGGDVELVEITADFVVKVRLTGSCQDCSMRNSTLKGGIEETVKRAVPEISAVESI
ncbi:MAG: NifU family protein [Flavobacteriia bacterium]|jgi:Fe-S cluster biogenesis protein NfuA|nr:NifU family protein [Flavobacteriia bacterium]NBV67155.1 NifU family protein [Flavobacteriia bacterium]NBV90687.1 NifU family protein [Flavobacteriia bacterium]NBY40457.1 NifU family protein [Flavobacteriia bacterium]